MLGRFEDLLDDLGFGSDGFTSGVGFIEGADHFGHDLLDLFEELNHFFVGLFLDEFDHVGGELVLFNGQLPGALGMLGGGLPLLFGDRFGIFDFGNGQFRHGLQAGVGIRGGVCLLGPDRREEAEGDGRGHE